STRPIAHARALLRRQARRPEVCLPCWGGGVPFQVGLRRGVRGFLTRLPPPHRNDPPTAWKGSNALGRFLLQPGQPDAEQPLARSTDDADHAGDHREAAGGLPCLDSSFLSMGQEDALLFSPPTVIVATLGEVPRLAAVSAAVRSDANMSSALSRRPELLSQSEDGGKN